MRGFSTARQHVVKRQGATKRQGAIISWNTRIEQFLLQSPLRGQLIIRQQLTTNVCLS